MPPADSSALIVARFLKSNNYDASYDAFIDEAGLPRDAGNVSKGDLTLETLLEEKKTFDLSVRFEKLGTGDGTNGWTEPTPSESHASEVLERGSNLLSTTVESIVGSDGSAQPILFATTADRRLQVWNARTCTPIASLIGVQDSPILSCAVFRESVLLTTSMSGQMLASDLKGNVLDKRRDHTKYVVKVAIFDNEIIATAAWDSTVRLYKPAAASPFRFGEPYAALELPSKPEAILFIRDPEDSSRPILVLSRTDSSFIYYYSTDASPRLLGKQNLAPHSNAWVAFTPSALALCPTDPTLLAVGTSSIPHMKMLIVKLLVPASLNPAHSTPTTAVRRSLLDDTPATETQASRARAALALADREAAAIQIHATTMAPQTAYSTPAVTWRPDGSGVWVNGDDGPVRGIEASTGKVVSTLQKHIAGSKVRCLWAGMVGEDEWLVSGGFDQKLIVWKAPAA